MNSRHNLIEMTTKAFVIAHKEDTTRLESVLSVQGFEVQVQRGPYTNVQQSYSSALKCLVNHAHVWTKIAAGNTSAIVIEADFVPVRNFSSRLSPLPYDPSDDSVGFAWLYSAGSILYGFDRHGFPHGHGNTTVAYILTPRAAHFLVGFFERETAKVSAGAYSRWETYLGIYLRKECGILNHIPVYQYGEHGGIPQPEHALEGGRPWHQADILFSSLEFLPLYARNSSARYLLYRARSIARGWVRLLLLRFHHPRYINKDSSKGRLAMAWFSFARLLKLIQS